MHFLDLITYLHGYIFFLLGAFTDIDTKLDF